MKYGLVLTAFLFATAVLVSDAAGQTPPPAPTLLDPANGAALVQPIMLRWAAIVDPDGPIGSYTWQLSTTSTFGSIAATGSINMSSESIPTPTEDMLSGVPNGSYFWRVMGRQMVGGATGSIDSPWSAVRSLTITGLGPAPGVPSFTTPASGSQFHVLEGYQIRWTDVPGAHYYLWEVDDASSFSSPLSGPTMKFGTTLRELWGNEINLFYRVRAVSTDNVRGLPSATLNVTITNTAPVPPAPTPLAPVGGASVSLPFTFDWSDTPNPQIPGYDVDVDDEPNFQGTFGVLFISDISRSDYMLSSSLAPGTYFWRVRAIHGAVIGPWSAGASFTVVASPPTPPGLAPFWLIAGPGTVTGGNPTQARFTLNAPAPTGGALIHVASDMPHATVPATVMIPAGATDATVFPVTSTVVSGATFGSFRATYGGNEVQSSLGMWNILWGASLSAESVVGGSTLTGTITLQFGPAPAGGVVVSLVSSNTVLAQPPASVVVPAGATGATFSISTSPVTVPTRVVFDTGTAFEGYRAPENWLNLMPAGSPEPAPSLSALSLNPPTILGGATSTGTVTLTAPAPPGGAAVWLNGSMEGTVVTPIGGVTIPAGSISADFPITAPPSVLATHWVFIQARYGTFGGTQAKTLQINPGPPAAPTPHAIGVSPNAVTSGQTSRGTVGLSEPAPPGGTVVTLSSDNPSAAQVPASVTVAAGNSANSFTITTGTVITQTSVRINATAGGSTKFTWLSVNADPNAGAVLLSVTPSVSGTTGGTSIPLSLFLNAAAPAGGAVVTLSSSNPAAAQVPASVTIPAGSGFASTSITTFPVAVDTVVTITGTYGVTQTATITVLAPPPPPPNTGFKSPTANAADSGGDGNGFESNAASAHADDALNAVDNNGGTASSTSCTSTARDKHRFFNYALGVPAGASIVGLEVRLDARADSTSGAPKMCVELSWNGGASWTATKSTPTLTTGMATHLLGGTADTWGRAWSSTEFSDANFRVRVINVASSTNRDFSLDWIAVRVHYQGGGPPPPDTTPPTVSVTAPAAAATVSGTVTISASASDNVGVTTVDFLVDGALLGTDTTSPYSASWNTTTALDGGHSLTARAFDAANNQATSAAVSVTVNNAPPPPASLSSISLSPTSVTGGGTSQGTATLTSAAPSGGAVVALSSGNTSAATVPASVTIAAGSTSANFTVNTLSVATSTNVTISGVYNAVTRTATLTVNPVPTGPLPAPSLVSPANDARFSPGQSITFDWSDVSGAANYLIQIDDNNSFPSPHIVAQTVTPSQYVTSTLPTTTMWWRVRANDASGNPGNWSSVRRVEVKN